MYVFISDSVVRQVFSSIDCFDQLPRRKNEFISQIIIISYANETYIGEKRMNSADLLSCLALNVFLLFCIVLNDERILSRHRLRGN